MKPFTSESYKQKKFHEARAACPEFRAHELSWDEETKQWLPTLAGIMRLARQESRALLENPLCVGDHVTHELFGAGTVVEVSGDRIEPWANVQFSAGGKKIRLDFLKKL